MSTKERDIVLYLVIGVEFGSNVQGIRLSALHKAPLPASSSPLWK